MRALINYIILLVSILSLNLSALANGKPNQGQHGAKFWVGEVGPSGPIFSGKHQYPFICSTFENGLSQPVVDNQDGIGNAVFPELDGVPMVTANPIGYSRNCGIPTRVDYFYHSQTANKFLPIANPSSVPDDVERITIKNKTLNFVVRLERGTINRFIYSIAMLAPFPEAYDNPKSLNKTAWNGKLVYKFQGGEGLGHWQGSFSLSQGQALHYDSLKRGYAVAYSTGTRTSTHYNLVLAEETAVMLKRHFKAVYGKPKYTVGIGASGGAVQQYVIGQNNRRLLDAAIPQNAFPDMVTQTIHVGDCELLERYFDAEYRQDPLNSRWGDWLERGLIEGLAASDIAVHRDWSASPFAPFPGANECINGWRGAIQTTFNPEWANPNYFSALGLYRYPPEVIANIKWTHWNDLGNIYPQHKNGVAYNTWDNVGVQYGLHALRNGDISTQEFLEINACVGGWKPSQEMTLGDYPWNPNADSGTLDPWDQANMNLSLACKTGQPAPRTEGNIKAMNIAYGSGHVFTGKLKIPIIDIRWYLEPVLDKHRSQASFAARARMIKGQRHADNQIIWFAECSQLDRVNLAVDCEYEPIGYALDVIDQWMTNIKGSGRRAVIGNKPEVAVDTCFNGDGSVLYAGSAAWDGILDDNPPGPCTSAFPVYATSRIAAGESVRGDVFKCALKSVDDALSDGTFGNAHFDQLQRRRLNTIFPSGVCDYSKPDVGKPGKK